jgi:Fe-S cluster assembly protein SufD
MTVLTDARRSFDVADFPMPTGREENWRFTPVATLSSLLDADQGDGGLDVAVTGPAPVTVSYLAAGEQPIGSVLTPADRSAAIAMARAGGAHLIDIAPGHELDEPVIVAVRSSGGTRHDHIVIRIGAQSKAVLVLDHVGSGHISCNVEVLVGDGANLTLVSFQDWDRSAVHLGAHAAKLGRDAHLSSTIVTLGGRLVRLVPTVDFAGPGGDAELLGVYLADGGQHQEHRILVDHSQPYCRSRVTYKGALADEGTHTVWIGDVVIRPEAIGTDTYELNRNLLLGDGPRADSVPNLEISTGDVAKAGHASATGRFDDEQVFYLCSRGIDAATARRLVVRGFFADVVDRIPVENLRERIMTAVDRELDMAAGQESGR